VADAGAIDIFAVLLPWVGFITSKHPSNYKFTCPIALFNTLEFYLPTVIVVISSPEGTYTNLYTDSVG
jgi:hypothetical protein